MHAASIIYAALTLAAAPPMQVDTPPPLPVPATRLAELRTMQDVVAATLLADGSRAPADILLPELVNRHHTLEYIRVHYPAALRKKSGKGLPVAWMLVNEEGRVAKAHLVTSSGYAALDSLSLQVLTIAEFEPARLAGRPIGVWVPFPARIPPYDELLATLRASTSDASVTPMKTPYTQKPVLLNRNQVEAAIIRVIDSPSPSVVEANEAFARSQQVGGKTDMWILIDTSGVVVNTAVKKTSGNPDLDASARAIARMMRFSPAKNGDQPVQIWLEVPINFKSR